MRDIKNYEGLYAITSCGRVYSYRSNKFLNPILGHNGYFSVSLSKYGKKRRYYIHRLVAEAYIPKNDNLYEINHKDEVKTHNWISNLEWCDRKYNINYGTHNIRSAEKRSFKIRCVETGEIFESMRDCERKTGCSNEKISEHIRGMRKHVKGLHFIKIEE